MTEELIEKRIEGEMEPIARQAFLQGYESAKSKESLREIEKQTAHCIFDIWWERNHEE